MKPFDVMPQNVFNLPLPEGSLRFLVCSGWTTQDGNFHGRSSVMWFRTLHTKVKKLFMTVLEESRNSIVDFGPTYRVRGIVYASNFLSNVLFLRLFVCYFMQTFRRNLPPRVFRIQTREERKYLGRRYHRSGRGLSVM